MRHRVLRFLFLASILLILSSSAHANGVPVIYAPLNPAAVAPGGAGFTLTVSGTGFTSTAVVNWNGSRRTTTFISASQLSASIPASDIASASTAIITVTNPGSGGGISNPLSFQVAASTVGLAFQDSQISAGFGTNVSVLSPVVGDFNGDGIPDIVTAGSAGDTLHIFFGNGDGTFQSPVSVQGVPPGDRFLDLSAGDVNGDGKPDLIASYLDLSVTPIVIGKAVLLQNGDGTFQAPVLTPNVPNGVPTVVADVNGDGKPDLISACGQGLCVGLGNGDGTFSPSVVFTSPVNTNNGPAILSLAVGDFNGDGKLDIAFLVNPKYLVVIFGNGDGTFGPPSLIYDTGYLGDGIAVADFNGDGKLDLALYYPQNIQATNNGALSIFLGNGDGTFQEPVTLPGLPESGNLTVLVPGDFNADGHLDLVAQNAAILIGNGTGTFSHSEIPLPHFASVAADLNGDGRLDLIGTDSGPNLHILLQTPPPPDFRGSVNPTFQTVVTGSTATYSVSISAIDGFTGTVQFAVAGLPSGAIATFNPPTVTGSGTTTLTISTSSATPTGSYTITLTGTSGALVHTGTATLNVGPSGTDFTDFAGSVSPGYQTITPGSSTHYDLGISPINGFTGTVAFSVSGLPSGATAVFTPSTITGGSGTSITNISTSSSTATGSYPVIVTATSGSHVHSTKVNLNVGPAGTDFTDFTGSITPQSQAAAIGGTANYTVNIVPINGFNEDIRIGQEGTPTGVAISATTQSIRGGSGSSVITVSPGPAATPGTYTITLSFVGDANHSHIATITLTVTP